jgi:hypothetical protein
MRAERRLTPAETALRRLDEAADLLSSAQAEEFSLEVADTLRSYLIARFEFQSLPEALPAFAETLPMQTVQHRALFETFSSLLEFAVSMEFDLAAVDLEAIRDAARHVIIRTTLTGKGAGRSRW